MYIGINLVKEILLTANFSFEILPASEERWCDAFVTSVMLTTAPAHQNNFDCSYPGSITLHLAVSAQCLIIGSLFSGV